MAVIMNITIIIKLITVDLLKKSLWFDIQLSLNSMVKVFVANGFFFWYHFLN